MFLVLVACTSTAPDQILNSPPTPTRTPNLNLPSTSPSVAASVASPTPQPSVTRQASITASPEAVGTSIHSSSPSTPLLINFTMAKAPKVSEPVSIKVTVRSVLDAPNTTANLDLPAAVSMISGTSSFKGDLKKNEPVTFEAVIRFMSEGDWTVRAVAKRVVSQDEIWGDAAYIYLNVGRDSGHFGFGNLNFPPTPSTRVPLPPGVTPSR